MDSHDIVRLWQGYKEHFSTMPSELVYEMLKMSGIQTTEELEKMNFANFIKLVEYLGLDTREKSYLEVQSELLIIVTEGKEDLWSELKTD